jgi:hypothetical protein
MMIFSVVICVLCSDCIVIKKKDLMIVCQRIQFKHGMSY